MTSILVVVAISAVWLLVFAVYRASLLARQKRDREYVEREHGRVRQEIAQLEKEATFHSRFLLQFPSMCEGLTSRLTMRQLPEALLEVLLRTFNPDIAVVVLRRRVVDKAGVERATFHVVASHPRGGKIRVGLPVRPGEGQLGAALQGTAGQADDLGGSDLARQARSDAGGLAEIRFDVVAPMSFGDEMVGVLAVAGQYQRSAMEKEVIRLVAQIAAITYHNVAAYRQMKQSAERDLLTGALNKASITKQLGDEIEQASTRRVPLSIFLFDIDNFKHYNDTNGHVAGDQLLQRLAQEVQGMIRTEDVFGRFGGEEFLLVLPETDRSGAMKAADKIRAQIAAHDFLHAGGQPLGCLSISGGVATFPCDGRNPEHLLALADEALYSSKKAGRNRVSAASGT